MAELRIPAGTKAVLIAGPTASGKSRLALDLALEHDGLVINADSMQVYAELRILTARPSIDDEASAEHRLYGQVPASTRYSVGRWLEDVGQVLGETLREGRLPIIVGGTGLYFKALTEGLAQVPQVPAEVRQEVLAAAEGEASQTLHRRLAETDPEDAGEIRPSDRSRILRALEVYEATGRSLAAWRARPATSILDPATAECVVLEPGRTELHERIAKRAGAMIHQGALKEATALGNLGLSPDLPAMKAIGVRELLDHACGKISLEETLAGMKTETRRYAKRQMTWFRHQAPGWRRLPA